MSTQRPEDAEGQDLIETYFVYRDEWLDSRLYRCPDGHVALTASSISSLEDTTPTCFRVVSDVLCGKLMTQFTPDDEGLTALEWAKRLLKRSSQSIQATREREVLLERAVRDLIGLIELGTDVQKNLHLIKSRPEVKRVNKKQQLTTIHGTSIDELKRQQAENLVGQHKDYIVLTEEERAKGFVRPVRDSYQHVGSPGPKNPLRDLTEEEHERYDQFGYVKYEAYPDTGSPVKGRFWSKSQLERVGKGCGAVTKMNRALAESYARDPSFYGSTFCVGCNVHLPVGEMGEFVWADSTDRVGS